MKRAAWFFLASLTLLTAAGELWLGIVIFTTSHGVLDILAEVLLFSAPVAAVLFVMSSRVARPSGMYSSGSTLIDSDFTERAIPVTGHSRFTWFSGILLLLCAGLLLMLSCYGIGIRLHHNDILERLFNPEDWKFRSLVALFTGTFLQVLYGVLKLFFRKGPGVMQRT